MQSDDERDPLERLSEEFLRRQRSGEAMDLASFAREHPRQAEEILALFPTLLHLEGAREAEPARTEDRIGRWRILGELGRGGMGVVYLAEDAQSGERVALKLMTSDHAGAAARFRREAEAVGRVKHPEICGIVDVGAADDRLWIAFEYLEGETVSNALRRARREQEEPATGSARSHPDPARWLAIGEQVASALHATHEAGLVHRDIKPANLMLTPEGRAVVLDFGLAHDDPTGERTRLTHTGVPVGTPAYMSPEQVHARPTPLDGRTDVYALGATLYEALTLQPPFEGPTVASLFSQILTRDPEPARKLNPTLTRDQELVLTTALEKRPERRYKTALDFANDLERARTGQRVRARAAGPLRKLFTWAARNPVAAAVSSAIALALTTGLIVALSLLSVVREARDEEAATARVARARALASASAEALRSDAGLSLLLARAAVRAERSPETISQLHTAVHGSLERARLPGHGGPVSALKWSADGEMLATGCEDGYARLFTSDGTLQCIVPGEDEPAVPGSLRAALAPSATRWATVWGDGTARLWSSEGRMLARLDEHTGRAYTTAFLDDDTVATLGFDGRIAMHDADGKLRRKWRTIPEGVTKKRVIFQYALSQGPPLLHVMLRGGLVLSYDRDGTEIGRRTDATASRGAIISEEGRMAYTPPALQVADELPMPHEVRVLGLDGSIVDVVPGKLGPGWKFCGTRHWWCAWSTEGGATIIDRTEGTPRPYYLDLQASERPKIICTSTSGGRILTSRSKQPLPGFEQPATDPIRLWTPRGGPLAAVSSSGQLASQAALSPHDRSLAVGWHVGGVATIHATAPGELATGVPRWRGKGSPHAPQLMADGSRLLYVHSERELRVLGDDGKEASRFELPSDLYHGVLQPTLGLYLAAGVDGAVRIHDLDGKLLVTVPASPKTTLGTWVGQKGGFATAIPGPQTRFHDKRGSVLKTVDGRPLGPDPARAYVEELAVLSSENLTIYDANGRGVRAYVPAAGERPTRFYGSPSGRSLIASRKGRVRTVFRCLDEQGNELWQADVVAQGAGVGAISRDGSRVVIPARGGLSLRAGSGEPLAHLDLPGGVCSATIGGPQAHICVSTFEGLVRVWDRDGTLLFDLPNQGGRAEARFSADGRRIATGTNIMSRLYTADVDELEALAAKRSIREFSEAERDRYAEILERKR